MKFRKYLNISLLKVIDTIALGGVLLVGGCAKLAPEDSIGSQEELVFDFKAPSFKAETDATKVGISSDRKIFWTKYDRVSIFDSTTDNLQYVFTGETGSRTGILQKIDDGSGPDGQALEEKYALYPYNEANSISNDGVLTVTLPATQSYSANAFGQNANIMAAVSTDNSFNFKNVGSYLVVRLYGEATVQKIVLTSTNGEKLSGEGKITFNDGIPSLTMQPGASTSLTLECGEGVKLGRSADKATEFWFVIPPVNFEQGFTIQTVCSEGSFAKQKITPGSIHRNEIISVSAFSVATQAGKYLGKIRESEIWNIDKIMEIAEDEAANFEKYETIINTALTTAKGLRLLESSDIKLSRIKYTTTDPWGNVVEASGIVAFPTSIPETSIFDRSTSYEKMVSLQHISWNISDAPSMSEYPYEAAAALKKGNDVVLIADYLGYGVSQTGDLQHPYIHNELTGSACADLIEAAQDFLTEEGLTQDSDWEVELVGYSQGGAATISTLLELEKRGYNNIGDVYAGGAPLDLPVFLDKFIKEKYFKRPGYIPYLIRGIVYGDKLDIDFHNLFAEEIFTSGAFKKFSTDMELSKWDDFLSNDLTKILHPDFFAEGYNANADILKVIRALELNSCSNFTPVNKAKIKLYHSLTDDTVIYDSAKKGADAWGISINGLELEGHEKAAAEFFGLYFNKTVWNLVKDYF